MELLENMVIWFRWGYKIHFSTKWLLIFNWNSFFAVASNKKISKFPFKRVFFSLYFHFISFLLLLLLVWHSMTEWYLLNKFYFIVRNPFSKQKSIHPLTLFLWNPYGLPKTNPRLMLAMALQRFRNILFFLIFFCSFWCFFLFIELYVCIVNCTNSIECANKGTLCFFFCSDADYDDCWYYYDYCYFVLLFSQ